MKHSFVASRDGKFMPCPSILDLLKALASNLQGERLGRILEAYEDTSKAPSPSNDDLRFLANQAEMVAVQTIEIYGRDAERMAERLDSKINSIFSSHVLKAVRRKLSEQ